MQQNEVVFYFKIKIYLNSLIKCNLESYLKFLVKKLLEFIEILSVGLILIPGCFNNKLIISISLLMTAKWSGESS